MKMDKYGVELRRLVGSDMEKVRQWRNSDHVRLKFEYQEIITPEAQMAWFEGLSPEKDHYFMVSIQEEEIGVVHIKDVLPVMGQGEAGIFIGEEAWLGTPEPMWAVMTLMDFGFAELNLKTLIAKVKADEKKTLEFNAWLGYEVAQDLKNGFLKLRCTRENYFAAMELFRRE